MTAATSRLRRRGIGAGVAALVGLSGLGFAAMPAQAAAGFDPAATQVSGVDRFDTAARIATAAFPSGSSTVVVANGDRAIDAQAGAYAAGLNNAPILLTQKSSVPAFTVDAIKKLGATKAIVLGDSNSVDATALAQMTAAGLTVTVVAGDDRFETAADIYNLGSTKSATVFLARADLLAGQVSPDALAASPLSYDGTPVLLTNAASLPQATADAIKNGGVKNVVVLGNAITDSVKTAVTALGATVTTIAGDDRSLTAQKIAEYGVSMGKYGKTTATIANGDKIDALAAGPWAAKNMAPILLTLGTNALGTGTSNYLTANASTLTTAVAFGDTNSVPASLTSAAKAAGGGNVTSNQTFAVTPADSVVLPFGASATSANTRTYSATVPAGTVVDVKLFAAANVTTDANGVVSFADANSDNLADSGTTTGASITQVNGVPGASSDNITSGGTVTFSVTSTAAVNVVPVVFADAGDDDNLNLTVPSTANANAKTPADAVGLGGVTIFTASQAGLGTISSVSVAAVDTANNFFTSSAASYFYDSNDTFQYGGQPLTLDQFEGALGSGAVISGSYATSASGVSTFNITTPVTISGVGAPTVTVVNADGGTTANDVRVTYTRPSGNPSGTTYKLQRASFTAGTPGTAGTYADVAGATDALTSAGATTYTFSANNQADGTYVYRVVATAPVTGTATNGTASSTTTGTVVPGASDTAGPKSTYAALTTSAGLANTLDSGDVLTFSFDEPLTAPANGATVRVTDADGTIADLVAGTNATFALNSAARTVNSVSQPANTVLTVTLTGNPTTVAAGSTAGTQLASTTVVSDASGVRDLAGNAWDIAGSGDKSIG